MENEEKENKKSQILLSVIGILVLLISIIAVSYAAFSYTKQGDVANAVRTGKITMTYTEAVNGITITNAMPMTEEQGKVLAKENELFDFTVSADITGKTSINYEVVAVKDEDSTVPDENIRLYLEESDEKEGTYTEVFSPAAFVGTTTESSLGAPVGTMQLVSDTFVNDGTTAEVKLAKYYRFRMWVDSAYKIKGTPENYKVTIDVYGKSVD